ncbi:FAD-dependent oxidoreductase [Roseobacter sp. HKCCD9010]|uniref:GcvT family protein n=1 Tax=unclassified Roseobacter TaxID=196798 RepID=UPI0014926243|nr:MULTISPECIES: FAD-dependent oxidoreductase [unclassified Roseobacter]MBF9049430.1 FAD-dependent oxidoreductase [Rhodobacterales bacterium HKCCD4356]NNV11430.1 FAD-dependent oxidoreductase [Roseobacter sp. HKCCD7357]NNV15614.1 FAD-dependent oxidoreductase [Roseobacter sp. HKCCD8768]NNV25074.1 FAD-dependent oxidoreductase [Roseobacter sp. HKCCD8192]NNV29331.1 FAD-dependent oxidoreductase [Roseobacter sp. HKCCD9061]
MKSQYRVVVIGGGVVGASVLYHLAKFGWSDVCLLERSVLTAGSSWHAAGGIHALNADPNIAALQAYTIDLLPKIEEESGQNIGLHMTGGLTMAGTPDRWEWLQSAYRVFQSIGIEDCRLVTPEEAVALNPIMSGDGLLGGMWADREGYIDTTGTVHAYAGAAKKNGASVFEHTKVEELIQTADGWQVVTDKGTITCEHVVNAGGLWAKQVGRMAGIELPVSPLKHHYLISDTIPALEELDFEVPMTVDLEGFTYLRQDQKGVLLGIYEIDHEHWAMDGAPWDYGMELFQEDTDRIEKELILGFERYPALQEVGVKTWVNGAFTFSPDGNPLVGPVPGKPGYWCACAVMAGFLQGGGVGKSLAEWMIHGEPEADVYGMDVARYGGFAENRRYIRETTGQFYSRRFVMTYPNEQLPAGRPLKMAPAHDAMTEAGCKWGVSWDLEVPLYFAPKGFEETPTLKRSNAHDIVAEECRAIREGVGLLDITGFSRYEVTGPNAEAWLDRIMASKLPAPGRARLAPMLSETGKLKGDLTVFNWGDGSWWIMGSYYLRAWHMRWFNDHLTEGVQVRDLGEEICGFGLAGPKSRAVIERVAETDLSGLPFMGCMEADIGLIRARVARMSVTGEFGFEINCRIGDHVALRRMLLEAGAGEGLRECGFNAMLSTRLEKSFGIWNAEFTQGYTPGMTGMDRWIDWEKPDFIGRDAAIAERDGNGPAQVQVTLEIDADGADASGFEPIWAEGEKVGFVTSGGFGHHTGKSLAMALVNQEHAGEGAALSVHVVGVERAAKVIAPSPYDPQGKAMRG